VTAPVFCKDCRHRRIVDSDFWKIDTCVASSHLDPVTGLVVIDEVACRKRNTKLDCEFFEAGPPPVYAPKPPWWRRWFG
jgi:hypothetical protein